MASNQGHCSECDPLTECSEEEEMKEAPQNQCREREKRRERGMRVALFFTAEELQERRKHAMQVGKVMGDVAVTRVRLNISDSLTPSGCFCHKLPFLF